MATKALPSVYACSVRLARNQSDSLYRVATASGLAPTEFTLRREVAWSGIYHEESKSHLLVRPLISNLLVGRWLFRAYFRHQFSAYNVRAIVKDGQETAYQGLSWGNVERLALSWGKQIAAKNDWAASDQAEDAFTAAQAEETGNSPFSEDERRQIAAQLQAVQKYVNEELNLPSEQIARIEEKLDEVAEASKHMGRKDWLVYCLGTITALIITATVAAPVGEHIFTMIIHGLAHLFTGGIEPKANTAASQLKRPGRNSLLSRVTVWNRRRALALPYFASVTSWEMSPARQRSGSQGPGRQVRSWWSGSHGGLLRRRR